MEQDEDERYQQLLERHHYLGAIPKIGQTLRTRFGERDR